MSYLEKLKEDIIKDVGEYILSHVVQKDTLISIPFFVEKILRDRLIVTEDNIMELFKEGFYCWNNLSDEEKEEKHLTTLNVNRMDNFFELVRYKILEDIYDDINNNYTIELKRSS